MAIRRDGPATMIIAASAGALFILMPEAIASQDQPPPLPGIQRVNAA